MKNSCGNCRFLDVPMESSPCRHCSHISYLSEGEDKWESIHAPRSPDDPWPAGFPTIVPEMLDAPSQDTKP